MKWISVEEKLPPENEWLLMANPYYVAMGVFIDPVLSTTEGGIEIVRGFLPDQNYNMTPALVD